MAYICQPDIVEAWRTICRQKSDNAAINKLFGFLELLRCCDGRLENGAPIPNTVYRVQKSSLQKSLSEKYSIRNVTIPPKSDFWQFVLPNGWAGKILDNFMGTRKLDLKSVAIICLQNDRLTDADTKDFDSFVEKFANTYKLNNEIIYTLFQELGQEAQTVPAMQEPQPSHQSTMDKIGDTVFNRPDTLSMGCVSFDGPVAKKAEDLSAGPFIQTLYAAVEATKCLLLGASFDGYSFGFTQEQSVPGIPPEPKQTLPTAFDRYGRQCIFYGSPGTGKSYKINEEATKANLKKENVTRVTFHPDSDYASFVGCYKPTMEGTRIVYQFVPQAFTQAYIAARKNPDEKHLLVIEEINRGNCAQIFGDLFQLLDRNADGESEYPIVADHDLADYLSKPETGLPETQNAEGRLELKLPKNLYIYATMNTSDQSLFPMDAAFKRRWNWEYVPIDLKNKNIVIQIPKKNLNDTDMVTYEWVDFLRGVNKAIAEATSSEDKQLGEFFVKAENNIIPFNVFRSKVMFYLWQEVFKDEDRSKGIVFKDFSFTDLFTEDKTEKLHSMMEGLKNDASQNRES
jgi:hypothetical protein